MAECGYSANGDRSRAPAPRSSILAWILCYPSHFLLPHRVYWCVKLAGKSEIRIGWPCTASTLAAPTLLWVRIRASYVIFPSPAQTALNRRSAIRRLGAIAHAAVDVLTRLVH